MGLVSGLARLMPGIRHILLGRPAAGAGWFVAFALTLNFGLLAPVAWPGGRARAARAGLCGAAFGVAVMSHRRAARIEEAARRAARAAARAPASASASSSVISGRVEPSRKSC